MNVVALIQARMSSTRLPGKVLLPIGDLPAIVHTYRRVRTVIDRTYILYAGMHENRPLKQCCAQYALGHIGTPSQFADDVLGRYVWAAKGTKADWIVRITGDCPFIDPSQIAMCVGHALKHNHSFVTNISTRLLPRGLDVEVLRRDVLNFLADRVSDPLDREHVTRAIYKYCTTEVTDVIKGNPRYAQDLSHLRWTLDTPKDYEFFQTVAKAMDTTPPHPTATELMDYLNAHPEVKALCREPSLS